jgi:hypothetical protein
MRGIAADTRRPVRSRSVTALLTCCMKNPPMLRARSIAAESSSTRARPH